MIRHTAERDNIVFTAVVGRCDEKTDTLKKCIQRFFAELRLSETVNPGTAIRRQPAVLPQITECFSAPKVRRLPEGTSSSYPPGLSLV